MTFETLVWLSILLIIIIIISYSDTKRQKENFSIIRPYSNRYYPYTNPYSRCYQTLYGDINCRPNRYHKPRRYRRSWWL